MSGITKDLNYYLQQEHIDEMPTDPKLIEQLAREFQEAALGKQEEELTIDRFTNTKPGDRDERTGASSDAEAKQVEEERAKAAEEAAKKAKEEADSAAEVAAKAAADAEALKAAESEKSKEAKPEGTPDGVLAKDGKNIIPFAVLSNARERAEAAEKLAQERAYELEQLKAEKAGGSAQTEQAQILSDEELKALEEDSPTLAKILRAQQEHIQNLNTTVQNLATHATQQIVEAETEAKSAVQQAIDSNATLVTWQNAEDQTMYNRAAALDKTLRDMPEWKDKPFEDRFAKVVELTKVMSGEKPDVQEVKQPVVATQTAAEIRAAAEVKLAEKNKNAIPVSSSQIPGGTPPAVDEFNRVEQMNSVELGNKFLGMSREQLDAYLATL